ncbi:MAG: pyridoxamine 5'-phosphate oxidase [Polymorphobacter sp.]
MTDDPFETFASWFAQAGDSEPADANAMALATVSAAGQPSVRIVLLKAWDARGFVFYTNYDSHKGRDIAANPLVALDFHWKSRGRQIRIEGIAEPVSATEADGYFASRPRDSQLGAWASDQSRPMAARATFDERFAEASSRFDGGDVPRPPRWSGFRVVPRAIEFWEARDFRHHDRTRYDRAGDGWTASLLFP